MEDNLSVVFDGLFGIFRNLAEVGAAQWGPSGEFFLPAFVAILSVLAFFAGLRYVFDIAQSQVRPLLVIALAIIGFIAIGALSTTAESVQSSSTAVAPSANN